MIRGKNIKYTVKDIAEGFTAVNPIFLKALSPEVLKELYQELSKGMADQRQSKVKHGDMQALRMRNMRLQRLHSAQMVLRNYCRQKRVPLA